MNFLIVSQRDHAQEERFDVLKVIDFGLSEFTKVQRTPDGFIRRKGFSGTLRYMAPEMFRPIGPIEEDDFDVRFPLINNEIVFRKIFIRKFFEEILSKLKFFLVAPRTHRIRTRRNQNSPKSELTKSELAEIS